MIDHGLPYLTHHFSVSLTRVFNPLFFSVFKWLRWLWV